MIFKAGQTFFLGALLVWPVLSSAEQYLCVTDKSTGFSYDKLTKTWVTTTFTADEKYLVSETKDSQHSVEITKIGESYPLTVCAEGFSDFGYLFCGSPHEVYDFKMNKKNGRFLLTHTMGYFNVLPGVNQITDEGSDTPYMEIGRCSPF